MTGKQLSQHSLLLPLSHTFVLPLRRLACKIQPVSMCCFEGSQQQYIPLMPFVFLILSRLSKEMLEVATQELPRPCSLTQNISRVCSCNEPNTATEQWLGKDEGYRDTRKLHSAGRAPWLHHAPFRTGAFVRTHALSKRRDVALHEAPASLGMSRRIHAAWRSATNCWSYKNICWA